MKRIIGVALVGLFAAVTVLAADAHGQGKGKKHGNQGRDKAEHASRVDVHVAFGSDDVVVLREYYAPRYRNLPPGLQKKVARGGQLPPGWRKKLEPFPVAVERRLRPLPPEYRRGVIDGHAVIYNPRTAVIIDLAVLF